MGLQAYFQYVCRLMCGIPKVTLLGTPEDWMQLRAKVDRLPEYDLQAGHMQAWHQLLAPVLDEFVLSAQGRPNIDFWDRVCSHHGGGSGPCYLSGWVTVFAAFTEKGVWQGSNHNAKQWGNAQTPEKKPWPCIDMNYLPVGVVVVPVLVDDNGTQYDTQMFAGQFAFEATNDDKTSLQPRTDWCIAYEGQPRATPCVYSQNATVENAGAVKSHETAAKKEVPVSVQYTTNRTEDPHPAGFTFSNSENPQTVLLTEEPSMQDFMNALIETVVKGP